MGHTPLNLRKEAASIIAAIWLGLILGVSFYATPVKFIATGVDFGDLLLVGKVTFQGFVWVEFAAFALLIIAVLDQFTQRIIFCTSLLFLLLLVQKFAVLPILDNTLDQTVTGEATEGSHLHLVYILIECAKLVILFLLSLFLRSVSSQ